MLVGKSESKDKSALLIAVNSTILPGVIIGDEVIVGAGIVA